jgi:hypothetical protein
MNGYRVPDAKDIAAGKPVAAALAALMLLVAAPSAAPAADATLDWRFQVSLDGKDIGFHEFTVKEQGERRVLETRAEFDVKFLFINAFRYRHQNTEVWREGCLASIDAKTNRNGDTLVVRGERQEDGFSVVDSGGEKTLPRCVQTFAYWNPDVLEAGRLLNSQTGEYEDVEAVLEGEDRIEVDGEPVEALRYRLEARAGDITLWYSAQERVWLALEAPARGGRTIRYEPVNVPEAPANVLLAENR